MMTHKELTDSHSPPEIVKQLTSIAIESGVEVEVSFADAQINLFINYLLLEKQ